MPPPPPNDRRRVTPDDRRLALAGAPGLLDGHLRRLRALPAHGNRTLHPDQLFLGLLLAFFRPMARSLRLIEGCGDFGGRLDLPRLARSTTADALRAFDPAHLVPVIDDLRRRVPNLGGGGGGGDGGDGVDLPGIARRIVAADGTYFDTLTDVAWALHHTKSNNKRQAQVRANVQLDVATWTPQVVTVSGDDDEGEPAAFARDLLEGVLYVVDRNFVDFAFVAALLARDNEFVLRVKANAPSVRVLGTRALTAADLAAGVVSDERVELTGRDAPAGRAFRLVTIHTDADRDGRPQTIRLLTSLTAGKTDGADNADETDAAAVAAHVVGAIYRLRWQIELFFKWLKCWARMDHLLSTSRRGITVQLYVAVIAVLMMHLQTGRRVSIYALAALGQVANGQMSLDAAMAVIAKRNHERDLERARQARKRARKTIA